MKILENNIAVLDVDSHISRWIEESGRLDHDQSFLPVVLKYIKECDWVVDAGAFIGDHTTAYLDKVGPKGKVWAFEINPESYKCLVHNCIDAICYPCGLGNVNGEVGLVEDTNKGASCISGKGYLPVVRLDSLRLPRLDFYKLDIEGYEVKALYGSRDTIDRCKPIICTEVNKGALERNGDSPESIFNLMKEFKYEVAEIYPPGSVGTLQYDVIFKPL